MKHILLFAFVFIVHIYQSSSQAIRLDSLWTKFGGVGAMSFSPDSKTLLIAELQKLAGGSGTIRFYDAATGIEKDSIPETEYYDVRYTPDGKRIVQAGFGGEIKLYKAETYKLETTINAPQNAGYIDFSPETNLVVSAGSASITIFDIEAGIVKAVLSRPYKYATGPNTTDYYWNGKVTFSADGKYIIGKYQNSLARWDWRNAPDKPEIIIGDLGNRAIIGFSPDKKYMVQQSNYLWDLQQGKQISIEGLTGYESETAYGFASTIGSSCMVVTEPVNHTPQFINLATKKVLTTSPLKYVVVMSISPDSNYFAYQYGSGQVHLHKVVWNSTGISEGENGISTLTFKITPQPSNSLVTIKLNSSNRIPQCTVELFDNVGSSVLKIYQGELPQGESEFHLNSSRYPSGRYYVRVKYGTQEVVHGFIITQ